MKHIILLYLVFAFLALSCSNSNHSYPQNRDSDKLASMREMWRKHNVKGEYDSVISKTRGYLKESISNKDTLAIIYSGSYIAQAHLYNKSVDSVRYYLNMVERYKAGCRDKEILGIYDAIFGCYLIKVELDYHKALEHFNRALEYAKEVNDLNNQMIILANISNLFYIRSDKHGLEYAEQAYNISKENNMENYPKCQAALALSMMLQTSGEFDKMKKLLQEIDSLAAGKDYESIMSLRKMLDASYYSSKGHFVKADSLYNQALDFLPYTEPSNAALVYLQYGTFCSDIKKYEKSIKLYLKGIDLCSRSRNNEFVPPLLTGLSESYRKTGNEELSSRYLEKLKTFLDDLETYRKEQDFNNLMLVYQQMEYEHEIQSKEMDLLITNKRLLTIAFSSIILVLILSGVLIMYFRQKTIHRKLVQQHQNYLHMLNNKNSNGEKATDADTADAENEDAIEHDLFEKVENLMKKDKIYHSKDLSLDKLAQILGTNRTYISRAINKYANATFYMYLDRYRIHEATELISDPQKDIPFKEMADYLGYNSLQVFHKAFKRQIGCTPGSYRSEIINIQKTSPEDK